MTPNESRWWRQAQWEVTHDWAATRSWLKNNQELVRPLAEQDAVAMYDLDDPLVRVGIESALGRQGCKALRFLRLVRCLREEVAFTHERGLAGSEWSVQADLCCLLGKPVPDRESFMRARRGEFWAKHLATAKGGA